MMKHIPHSFSLAMELGSISGDTHTCRVTSAGLQKIYENYTPLGYNAVISVNFLPTEA